MIKLIIFINPLFCSFPDDLVLFQIRGACFQMILVKSQPIQLTINLSFYIFQMSWPCCRQAG